MDRVKDAVPLSLSLLSISYQIKSTHTRERGDGLSLFSRWPPVDPSRWCDAGHGILPFLFSFDHITSRHILARPPQTWLHLMMWWSRRRLMAPHSAYGPTFVCASLYALAGEIRLYTHQRQQVVCHVRRPKSVWIASLAKTGLRFEFARLPKKRWLIFLVASAAWCMISFDWYISVPKLWLWGLHPSIKTRCMYLIVWN